MTVDSPDHVHSHDELVIELLADDVLPENLDESFVPRSRSGVASIELDGGWVLYDDVTDVVHFLNPAAVTIWACCDGSGTAGELIDDFAAAYEIDRALIANQVMAVLKDLGLRSMLEHVWGTELCPICDLPFEMHHRDATANHDDLLRRNQIDDSLTIDEPRYVEVFDSTCQTRVDELFWADRFTIEHNGVRLGVRVDDPDAAQLLRGVFAAHIVEGDSPPNFSLRLAVDGSNRGIRAFNILHEGHVIQARARGAQPLVEMLVQRIESRAGLSSRRLQAGAFVHEDGRAIVVPDYYVTYWPSVEPTLYRKGIRFVPGPLTLSDVGPFIVIRETGLSLDSKSLSELADRFPGTSADRTPAATGRYTITSWGFALLPSRSPIEQLTGAEACALLLGKVVTSECRNAQEVLDSGAALLASAPFAFAPPSPSSRELSHYVLSRLG